MSTGATAFRSSLGVAATLALAMVWQAAPVSKEVDWPSFGGSPAANNYSPLTGVTPANVSQLAVAWTWKTGETPQPQYNVGPGMFENTPLMIDGVLYVTTPYNRVVALNPSTGIQIWAYDPRSYVDGQPPNGTGYVHRGVAAWRDGSHLHLFLNTRYRLISIDAATGEPDATFGDNGVVDLSQGLIWPINKLHYTETSPPVVYKNLVIVGNGVGDRLVYHHDPPGDVRAFDARTGRQVWSFHTIPQVGEYGHDTWGNGSAAFTGHTNVWAPMSLDRERGLVYLPVSTPSNDFYGGARPGNGLFGETLVCLNAATGQRVWDFQIVHHGLWDYDLATAPTLVTITVDGRKIDAVAQLTKEGFAFVFDRVTGKPVWPIVERPVPASDVPGEHASPTQPMPTRPPAYTAQGVSLDDAFDLSPQLHADALAAMKKLRLGPLFTPPSLQGTLARPGDIGGANWGGGAFDPASAFLFVKSTNQPSVLRVAHPDHSAANPRAAENDAEWSGDLSAVGASFDRGIPLTKPPYGELTAIDLNHGTLAWHVPFGDWAGLRSRPSLQGVALPAKLGVPGPQGPIVTAGGLVFVGAEDTVLHAFAAATGEDLWQGRLPSRAYGTPLTYRTSDGRQFVVIATGTGPNAALVAFALGGEGSH
ncbi:MAG TPA: pyrroloquinoline quinone-dependent dehydrogenase [Terriglobales bacterium]